MLNKIIKKFQDVLTPLREKTVLVIDDSAVDRRLAASVLEKKFFVLTACGGKEGVLLARDRRPDLILLDFMMPEMQGPEVCRCLKEHAATKDIPVIFLTSMDTPATVVDSLQEGAEIYLTKPVHPHELLRQVEMTLETACAVKE